MESFVQMIQLLITVQFLAWKMKHCALDKPTHLVVKEQMSAKKKQRTRLEHFARILLFVTHLANYTKFLAQVVSMSLDARNQTCASPEEGILMTNFVPCIVQESAQKPN